MSKKLGPKEIPPPHHHPPIVLVINSMTSIIQPARYQLYHFLSCAQTCFQLRMSNSTGCTRRRNSQKKNSSSTKMKRYVYNWQTVSIPISDQGNKEDDRRRRALRKLQLQWRSAFDRWEAIKEPQEYNSHPGNFINSTHVMRNGSIMNIHELSNHREQRVRDFKRWRTFYPPFNLFQVTTWGEI